MNNSDLALLVLRVVVGIVIAMHGFMKLGWVGKGDVQTAFAFNNSTMQKKHTGVVFTYMSSTNYEAVCTFTTGEGTRGERIHNVEHNKTVGVNATISADSRKTGQWTGWFLTGLGSIITQNGDVPVVDAPCMGNAGHEGVWTSVTILGSGEANGLFATVDGVTKNIPITPVTTITP